MFVTVGEISSYVVCPRLCYFRMIDKVKPNDLHAVKEIYLSMRKGFDERWALERYSQMFDDLEVFERSLKNFVFDSSLEMLRPLDWEVRLVSEKIRLKGILDEIVEFKGSRYPLILSLRSPEEGVWFKDRIKLTAFCMLLELDSGFVYHCFDGNLKRVDVTRRDRYHVLKLIERVIRLKKGFLPERKEKRLCLKCEYREACASRPSTFASKFL